MAENKRFFYLSFIRVIACLSIVILHSFKYSLALLQTGTLKVSNSQITCSNIMLYLMNWAVPCFVMVTGALLLDNSKKVTYKKLFSKYILKMVLIILIFSILFQIIDTLMTEQSININTFITGLKNAVFNKSWIHMWYLYMVIAVYLMLPIYRKITVHAEKKDIIYLLILYTVFLVVVDTLCNGIGYSDIIINQSNYNTTDLINAINEARSPAFYIFVQKVWPLYLFLGYAMHKNIIKIKPLISIIMLITGISSIIVLSILSSHTDNMKTSMICNVLCSFNSSPIYLFLATSIFSLCKQINELKTKWVIKIINAIDFSSFGIYLIHLIPIKIFIAKFKFNPYNYGGILGMFIFSLVIMILSFIVVYGFEKITLLLFKKIK